MLRNPPIASLALAATLAACGGGGGSDSTPVTSPIASGPGFTDNTAYSSAPGASLPSALEGAAVTSHVLTLAGRSVAYTATAGHLSTGEAASGAPKASMFYVAYTADGASAATRPLVFFYNGGPGSATVWLHLGSFGPRRIVTNDPSTSVPSPFQLVDNLDSLIDTADLVFVDAVGAGFSEAIAPATNQSFWSVDADASVMRDFITRYVAANQRADSPTFLYGESYGATRSAVLANLMVTNGMRLDGIVLNSSVLDYNSNCGLFDPGQVSCAGYLPSYGMAGAWFGLLTPQPTNTDVLAQQLRDFTDTQYTPAVAAFLGAGTAPGATLLEALVARTGAPRGLWSAKPNLDPTSYRSLTLPGQLMGRYDARVAAASTSALAAGGDPSSSVISAPFTSAQRAHLANELRYANASTYTMLSGAINSWDFAHDGRSLPDTIPDLATALAQRPALRVLSLNGYHDLATPFRQTELDLARMGSTPGVQIKVYPGGHMTYLDDGSRPLLKADLVRFITGAP